MLLLLVDIGGFLKDFCSFFGGLLIDLSWFVDGMLMAI